jgi:hypothetical protein
VWLKKGTKPPIIEAEAGWQLPSSATRHAVPGTVLGVGKDGTAFVLDRLTIKTESTVRTGLMTEKRVRASVGTYGRFLGLGKPAVGVNVDRLESFTLEMPDAEAETASDTELDEQVAALLERLKPMYRADHRYFVVRATVSAPSVVPRFTTEQAASFGVSDVLKLDFPAMTRVAVKLDEIRVMKASLGGGPPTLGVAPAEDPLSWGEDVTAPWVTSIVDPIHVGATRTFAIEEPITLTTSIGIAAGEGELASVGISTAMLDNAAIELRAQVRGARVRTIAPDAPWAAVATSPVLKFEAASPAVFTFQLQADTPGPVALRVVLYLNGRPTMHHEIGLTAAAVAPAPAEPAAPLVTPAIVSAIDGRNLVTLPIPRVSLELGDYAENYPIELTIDGRRADKPAVPRISAADLAHKTIEWRKRLVALSEQYGRGEGGELGTETPDAMRAFALVGQEIHRALFGLPKQHGIEDLRRLADAIAQVQGAADVRPLMTIDAELLPLPWGVIYDAPLDAARPVDPRGFWGHRFLIERIAPAVLGKVPSRSLRGAADVNAQLVACVNAHLDDQQKVTAAANQRKFFSGLGIPGLTCKPVMETREDFGNWLAADAGESRLVYFFCHASSAKTIDDRFFQSRDASDTATWLDLDADEARRIDIKWLVEKRVEPLPGQPLIFLNACSTAEGDREFQSPFLTQFIRDYDARALIGSDWKIPTVFADAFARRFLHAFLASGLSLGDAYAKASREFIAAGNPFPLIYAIYGRTDIVVSEEQA